MFMYFDHMFLFAFILQALRLPFEASSSVGAAANRERNARNSIAACLAGHQLSTMQFGSISVHGRYILSFIIFIQMHDQLGEIPSPRVGGGSEGRGRWWWG